MLRTPPRRSSSRSLPKAPEGKEANWIPTGEDFFLLFRLYGPESKKFYKTWMLGDVPIYNYQADTFTGQLGDRRQRWHFRRMQVNLAFVDGHIGT